MILSGGGRDFTVPGKNVTVQGSLSLVRKELGGFTSATDSVTGGNKPKRLSVSLSLAYDEENELQALTAIAEAQDKDGDPIVYDIVDRTARGMKVRQVTFTDTLRVQEQDSLQAWNVTFSLLEHRSVAELLEERLEPNDVTAVTAEGDTVTAPGANPMAKLLEVTKGL